MNSYVFNSKLKRSKDLIRQYKEKESFNPPGNFLRDDLTEPFNDDPLKGILFSLQHRLDSNSKQMELLICYHWRQINDIINKKLLKNKWIRENIIYQKGSIRWNKSKRKLKLYSMYQDYKDLPLEKIYKIVSDRLNEDSSCGKSLNSSEKFIDENILNGVAPGMFEATANDYEFFIDVGKHKRRPDWINKFRGIIIEFHGVCHEPPFIEEPNAQIHIESRIEEYRKVGYVAFIITYHDLVNSYSINKMMDFLKIFLEKHKNRVFDIEVEKLREENHKQFFKKYTKEEMLAALTI